MKNWPSIFLSGNLCKQLFQLKFWQYEGVGPLLKHGPSLTNFLIFWFRGEITSAVWSVSMRLFMKQNWALHPLDYIPLFSSGTSPGHPQTTSSHTGHQRNVRRQPVWPSSPSPRGTSCASRICSQWPTANFTGRSVATFCVSRSTDSAARKWRAAKSNSV